MSEVESTQKTEYWTTDMSDNDEVMKALERFRELTESTACPMAVQGYVGIMAMMVITRMQGCCSQEKTVEATMLALGTAIANIVGILDEEGQKKSLQQLDAFIYKTVELRTNIHDPRKALN